MESALINVKDRLNAEYSDTLYFDTSIQAPPARKIPWGIIGKTFNFEYGKWRITKVYPYIAYGKMVDSDEERCFSIGDLVTCGLIPSMGDVEQ